MAWGKDGQETSTALVMRLVGLLFVMLLLVATVVQLFATLRPNMCNFRS
jgi:hypothetical protein